MSKMNLVIDLKGYDGNNTNTCLANFTKNLQYIGIDLNEETVQKSTVSASSTEALFSVSASDAKKIIYLEVTAECDIIVNGVTESTVKPLVIGTEIKNGVFLKTSSIESLSIVNNSLEDLEVYYITSK